jgi:hypothetical protein
MVALDDDCKVANHAVRAATPLAETPSNRTKWYARPVTLRNPGTHLVRPANKAAVLFELRALKMAECRGLAPHARRHALVSTEARLACPVGIPEMVRMATRKKPARRRSWEPPPAGFSWGFWPCRIPGKRKFPKKRAIDEAPWAGDGNRPVHDVSTFHVSFLLNGPRGRICACNLPGLSGTPLHWATRGWLAEPKLGAKAGAHGRVCTDTVRVLSALSLHWTTWAKLVPRAGFGFPSPPQYGCPKIGYMCHRRALACSRREILKRFPC